MKKLEPNPTTTHKLNHIAYIDGLKGIACLFVMFGHFNCLFRLAENMHQVPGVFDLSKNVVLKAFVSESFWLYLFLIVSGYLAAMSSVKTFREFFRKSVKRFLRLLLPVFGAFLLIYLLQIVIGFHNQETHNIIENEWFQGYYRNPITLTRVFVEPFEVVLLRDGSLSSINPPYWVISTLFYCPVVCYFCSLLKERYASVKSIIALIALVVSYSFFGIQGLACGIGMFIFWYQEKLDKICQNKKLRFVLWMAVIAMPLGMHSILFRTVRLVSPRIPRFMDFGGTWGMLYFPLLIALLHSFKSPVPLFEGRLSRWLSKISFGIYSFHWPVFCSLGCFLLLKLFEQINISFALLIMMAATVGFTFLLSLFYSCSVERVSTVLISKADRLLKKHLGG